MNRTWIRKMATAAVAVIATLAMAGCGGSSNQASSGSGSAGCTPKWKFDTIQAGTLTVAAPDQPPYYFEQNGQPGGLDGKILVQFAKDACLKTNFVTVASSAAIQSAITRRADVVAGGWDATPDRAPSVGQTDPTYADLPSIVSKQGLSKFADLNGKTVGTVTGYFWVPELQKDLGANNVKTYPGNTNVLEDLQAGRLDAAVLSAVEAGYAIAQNPQYKDLKSLIIEKDPSVDFTHAGYASNFPHIKGNQALTDALNAEIKNLKASGWFSNLLKQFGLPPALGDVTRPSWQK